jgi:(p)ppGpp synthase/HD superfamily hydrolase
MIEKAFEIAEKAHFGQMYGAHSYMFHIRQVVNVAKELNLNEDVIVGCILHDVLEDSEYSYEDLRRLFNRNIAEIVYCVTDEKGESRKERKERTYPKTRSNYKSVLVKICDRIANVRHAKENDRKLYKMYKKEHRDFFYNLVEFRHPHRKMYKAWSTLKNIFENG